MTNNELYHYGIKGQKWGVRRFENADGTLTAEGRERYANNDSSERLTLEERKNRAAQRVKKPAGIVGSMAGVVGGAVIANKILKSDSMKKVTNLVNKKLGKFGGQFVSRVITGTITATLLNTGQKVGKVVGEIGTMTIVHYKTR